METLIKKFKKRKHGFTIIETMISIALFIVVILAGMNALLNANLLHQKSQSMRSIMDNMSFVMEDMSRNMRTGYNFHCVVNGDPVGIPAGDPSPLSQPKSCTTGWAIAFEQENGFPNVFTDQWVYYIDVGTDVNGKPYGRIFRATSGPYIPSAFVQMTPDEVVISSVSSFSVLGAESVTSVPSNKQQPLVGIRLVGTITVKGVVTPFSLQTSVSQRNIDI